MEPTDWTIDLVNGEAVKRSDFVGADVQLHVLDYGVMVRTLYPTRETTYPWHTIVKLSTKG
ncbi:hypothetical protein [Streptomyces sparsogenes]|uniref:Uncharacterized protein n=1 Tax=Streptomyces sparsogenes DSM 40356 TaxID=1331668 RepID=A0A1R1S7Z6_9ACTN|nr:hypothetical protein [Streptomyces sparsogenes]OMI34414.1 hypothetical protein SPAR_36561 [Streptomyces sparsogenes DSM 40356]